jgi:hypothetical protein
METAEESVGHIPERVMTLDRIAGMEASKRALEVALAGEHPVVFLYNVNSQAVDLVRAGKRVADKHGLPFHGLAYPCCKCGNYGSRIAECRCKPASVRRRLVKLGTRIEEFDLWMDACRVRPADINDPPGQAEEVTAERIMAARRNRNVTGEPDSEARELLTAWQKHIGKRPDTDRILRVARTIASLDGICSLLRSQHVAEAIQYQVTALSWVWECLEPQPVELSTQIETPPAPESISAMAAERRWADSRASLQGQLRELGQGAASKVSGLPEGLRVQFCAAHGVDHL